MRRWTTAALGLVLLGSACAAPSSTPVGSTASAPVPSSSSASASSAAAPSSPTPTSAYVATVAAPAGCREVGPEIAGVKVYLVQQALGLVGHRERYDATTENAVRAVQDRHGLPVTGRVDAATWLALGIGEPFCLDRFVVQPTVVPDAAREAHVAAATAFAHEQVGRPYVWGGAGPVGYDCSGLVLQALHAGGVVVPGVTVDRHVEVDFATAAALAASPALVHVPLAQRRAGDLVFWGTPKVTHVALSLGDDRIVEAVRPAVRTASLWAHGDPLPTVARPFPDAAPPR